MTAIMNIAQVGLGGKPDGEARTDGLNDGALVTLTSKGAGLVHVFRLLWVPSLDVNAVVSLVDLGGDGTVWTFSPTPLAYGSYRIELDVDGDKSVRIFGVRTPGLGLLIPAFNEVADEKANLFTAGAAQVLASENNEPSFANPAINYAGWWVAWEQAILALDGGGSGGSTIVVGPFDDGDSPVTASYDETIRVNPDTGAVDITLPLALGNAGRRIEIVSVGVLENPPLININTQGGDTYFDGTTTLAIDTKQETALVRSDGAGWLVILG